MREMWSLLFATRIQLKQFEICKRAFYVVISTQISTPSIFIRASGLFLCSNSDAKMGRMLRQLLSIVCDLLSGELLIPIPE